MKIHKKYIHNVNNYLGFIEDGTSFRVSVGLNEDNRHKQLQRAGFSIPTTSGDIILPMAVGPVSRFNADGRWRPQHDKPKESRYIRTVKWRWKQWSGRDSYQEMEDDRDIYRNCYVRNFISPPAIEITHVQHEGLQLLISPILLKLPHNIENIRHVINLFLELFGECELIHENLAPFISIQTQRVNWRMFPEGEHPWQKLEGHLRGALHRVSGDMQEIILDRQKTICEYGSRKCYVGLGGFSDYIAYLFEEHNLVVLESIRKDNAIYVFGKDWKGFSKLSKAEVLSNNFQLQRIIHTKCWKETLRKLLATHARK